MLLVVSFRREFGGHFMTFILPISCQKWRAMRGDTLWRLLRRESIWLSASEHNFDACWSLADRTKNIQSFKEVSLKHECIQVSAELNGHFYVASYITSLTAIVKASRKSAWNVVRRQNQHPGDLKSMNTCRSNETRSEIEFYSVWFFLKALFLFSPTN